MMVVLAVDREWKANEKASPRVAFKAGLLHDDDPNFSHPGVHYWFMTLEQFSLAWKNFEKRSASKCAQEAVSAAPADFYLLFILVVIGGSIKCRRG
jgi:hypothetical protein